MNKKLIPLIGIGALVGSGSCLLAKKLRMKKKASWDIDFEDDTLLADKFRIDDEPVRPGYTFNGWFTQATGGTKIVSTTTVDNQNNHSIYAQWTANTYTVTFGIA